VESISIPSLDTSPNSIHFTSIFSKISTNNFFLKSYPGFGKDTVVRYFLIKVISNIPSVCQVK